VTGADRFEPFSALHAAALLAIVIATVAAIRAVQASGHADGARGIERAIGIAFVVVWVAVHGWWLLPPRLDPVKTLPLQMCHWAALAAGLYLATRARWLAVLLYFWGLGLCTQALITPALEEGPATHVFWYFWLSHGMIVGVAAYALAVHGFRPTWRDWRFAAAAGGVYAAVAIAVNLAIGANYGFLGPSKPNVPTIVDALGPWPQRLPIIFATVAGTMALLMVPWAFARPARAQ
jgi:hypothetical integral membrane protein (TIGR02206 family)